VIKVVPTLAMFVLACMISEAFAEPADDAALLESVLRNRYPTVKKWGIESIRAVHPKHAMRPIAELELKTVLQDGNLFAVRDSAENSSIHRFVVEGFADVWVASSFIGSDERLSAERFVKSPRDVMNIACDYYAAETLRSDMRVRRDLHRGEVLCTTDVEPRPMIAKHDSLTVLCSQGPVQIAVAGSAITEGNAGQLIRVQRESTHTSIAAVITDQGEANACL